MKTAVKATKCIKADHVFRLIFILFAITTLTFSCADEKTDHPHDMLSGEWHLINFECCDLPIEKFDYNVIVWVLDEYKNEVTFINNTEFDKNS